MLNDDVRRLSRFSNSGEVSMRLAAERYRASAAESPAAEPEEGDENALAAVEALVKLGFKRKEAQRRISKVPKGDIGAMVAAALNL